MTIAELYGKLSSTGSNAHERLEDLLTSDVFTAFKYLKPKEALLPFLKLLFEKNSTAVPPKINSWEITHKDVRYVFWPKGNFRRREADLLILINNSTVQQYIFTIEAKYESGTSDVDIDTKIHDAEKDNERSGLQIAEEFEDLMQERPYSNIDGIKAPLVNRYLIYLTAENTKPCNVLKRSILAINDKIESAKFIKSHILWCNWSTIWQVFKQANWDEYDFPSYDICKDIVKLLERKGFKNFEGFGDYSFPDLGNLSFWVKTYFKGQTTIDDFQAVAKFWNTYKKG